MDGSDFEVREKIRRVNKQLVDSGMAPLEPNEILEGIYQMRRTRSGNRMNRLQKIGLPESPNTGVSQFPPPPGYNPPDLRFQPDSEVGNQKMAQGGLLQGLQGFSANIHLGSDGQVQGIQLRRDKQKLSGA